MKLSKCKSCGVEVALNTKICPNCGARVLHPVFGLVVALLLFIAVSPLLLLSLFNDNGTTSGDMIQSAPLPSVTNSVAPEDGNLILGPGTYTVGDDIAAGTYDCIAISGFGVLRGDIAAYGDPGFVQMMGSSTASVGGYSATVESADSYSNLTLGNGDIFYIEMSLKVEFVPK